jgi:hypothetical protein
MRLFLIPVAVVALTVGVSAPAVASDGWAELHRPLQLKPLKAGAACPVTSRHRLDHQRFSALGPGPAYPLLPSRFEQYDRFPGWLAAKTLWTWPPRLLKQSALVLVRGKRLDKPGAMRFQLGPNWDHPPRSELRINTIEPVGSFSDTTWGATVTMLLARTPGCYGLQLDTRQGTSTIVVAA